MSEFRRNIKLFYAKDNKNVSCLTKTRMKDEVLSCIPRQEIKGDSLNSIVRGCHTNKIW